LTVGLAGAITGRWDRVWTGGWILFAEAMVMALGKRKTRQQKLWVATTELPRSPGYPFYQKLNQLLAEDGFDD
jgi:hypothetical protein